MAYKTYPFIPSIKYNDEKAHAVSDYKGMNNEIIIAKADKNNLYVLEKFSRVYVL